MANKSSVNFIDFILEAQRRPKLGMDLMKKNSPEEVKKLLDDNNFKGFSPDDYKNIYKVIKNFRNRIIEVGGGRYY